MKNCLYKHLIGGRLLNGSGEQMNVFNPATGDLLAQFSAVDEKQAITALEAAQRAFNSWSIISVNQREQYINCFMSVLEDERESIIDLLIAETGKPLGNATYDYEMLLNCLKYFIEEAKRIDQKVIPDNDGGHLNIVLRKPVGVVLGYLAWNFPLLNMGYKLGPILASGCTCVLKPSSMTPLTSLYVGELAKKAGIPNGVINVIAGHGESIAGTLNGSTIPKLITLIGSSQTGRNIIAQSATSIKHYSLELGGNAPVIVFPDADISAAAAHISNGKFDNAGQICVAPNRVFVHENVKERFIKKVLEYVDRITFGSGRDKADVLMGPMVSKEAVQYMQELVKDAVEKGAKVLCGGKIVDRKGYFFEPTVLEKITRNMRVYNEEIFGPILPMLTFSDADDPVTIANDTKYGLAAYIYTSDLKTAINMSQKVDFGSVCVNEPFYNYNLPHGGCKESGVGKDCSSFSLEEYYYVQRISIKL